MVGRVRREEGLLITFTRGNDTIEQDKQWAVDGREANKLALKMLLGVDELTAGDRISVTVAAANSNNARIR
jgi:hypothetical protein